MKKALRICNATFLNSHFTRVDLVWQFRGDTADFILAHRNARHPRIHRGPTFFEQRSMAFKGSEMRMAFYDKRLQQFKKKGDVVRVEVQLKGAILMELLGNGNRVTKLDFTACYQAYRKVLMGFVPSPITKVASIGEFLAVGEREGWYANGIPAFDFYIRSHSARQVSRLRKEMAAYRPSVFNIDWSQLLPPERHDQYRWRSFDAQIYTSSSMNLDQNPSTKEPVASCHRNPHRAEIPTVTQSATLPRDSEIHRLLRAHDELCQVITDRLLSLLPPMASAVLLLSVQDRLALLSKTSWKTYLPTFLDAGRRSRSWSLAVPLWPWRIRSSSDSYWISQKAQREPSTMRQLIWRICGLNWRPCCRRSRRRSRRGHPNDFAGYRPNSWLTLQKPNYETPNTKQTRGLKPSCPRMGAQSLPQHRLPRQRRPLRRHRSLQRTLLSRLPSYRESLRNGNGTGATTATATVASEPDGLTEAEKATLAEHEETIRQYGRDQAGGFRKLALACHQILRDKLYREYSTQAAYFKAKFGFKRAHSLRLAKMGQLLARVSPTGDTVRMLASDAHLRPLLSLTEDQQDAVISKTESWVKLANLVSVPAKLLAAARTFLNPPTGHVPKDSAQSKLVAKFHEAIGNAKAMLPTTSGTAVIKVFEYLKKKVKEFGDEVRRSTEIAWTEERLGIHFTAVRVAQQGL